MFDKLPLYNVHSSDTYNKSIITQAVISAIVSMSAVHFNDLSDRRMEEFDDCDDDSNSIFCTIYKSEYVKKIETILQTITLSLILHSLMFIILGIGDGSLSSYYVPTHNDVYSVCVSLFVILIVNIAFYYCVIIYEKPDIPDGHIVLYAIARQYGIILGK